jgi:hypothetical protein
VLALELEETRMTTKDGPNVPKRGEAAWKAVKEGVAERNEAAKKVARAERKLHLENAGELRRLAGVKRQANVKPMHVD